MPLIGPGKRMLGVLANETTASDGAFGPRGLAACRYLRILPGMCRITVGPVAWEEERQVRLRIGYSLSTGVPS